MTATVRRVPVIDLLRRVLRLWPCWQPFGRLTVNDGAEYQHARRVGTCQACDGAVLYSRGEKVATCACGASSWPWRFMQGGQS